eukprot:1046413-Amphidinium_carterae.1
MDCARWVQAAGEIVVEAQLPLSKVAGNDPKLLDSIGQGLRAGTLRLRVREWRRARKYFMATWNSCWPLQ